MRVLPLVALIALCAPVRAEASAAASEVDETVSRHSEKIRRCYRKALRTDPELRGKLVVKFRVGPSGRARSIAVVRGRSTIRHAAVEQCVVRIFRSMRFRRLHEPAWFHSPLIFT